jgi:hypothetical protein
LGDNIKSYFVSQTGHVDWSLVVGLSDFTYPWESEAAPTMIFKACHDSRWLYCQFEVIDHDPKVFVATNSKQEVILGDRVEIFFRKSVEMNAYYCLEIDLLGRIYDYQASWYRIFDPQWSWPAGELKVDARKTDDGYTVTAAISLQSLEQLGLLKANELQAGIFRGKCVSRDNMKWISWVSPQSEFPDFHVPSAFGMLKLQGVG